MGDEYWQTVQLGDQLLAGHPWAMATNESNALAIPGQVIIFISLNLTILLTATFQTFAEH